MTTKAPPYKKPIVVHLDAVPKALADLAAAREGITTKAWLSRLIKASVPADFKAKFYESKKRST